MTNYNTLDFPQKVGLSTDVTSFQKLFIHKLIQK